MKGFVGSTDNVGFAFLSQQPEIDEVSFSGVPRLGYLIDHSLTTTFDM
jgi:hypothetical protein